MCKPAGFECLDTGRAKFHSASAGRLVGKILRHHLCKNIFDLGFIVVPVGGNVCIESAA